MTEELKDMGLDVGLPTMFSFFQAHVDSGVAQRVFSLIEGSATGGFASMRARSASLALVFPAASAVAFSNSVSTLRRLARL